MRSSSNKLIIAAAGSGKTTHLAQEALAVSGHRIAIVTYTNSNVDEILDKLRERHGVPPSHTDVMTWFTFLLRECARPYQRALCLDNNSIAGLCFTNTRSARFVRRAETARYFFNQAGEIYSDKISEFVLECDDRTSGCVTKRLSTIYDGIFIDEMQDLAGYDLNLVERILRSSIRVIIVGDPRQTTYATNPSGKNRRFRGTGILGKAREWESKGLCQIERQSKSHRCNQAICDFADRLWPDMEATVSHNHRRTGHDGVFVVRQTDVHDYVRAFTPIVLRYDKRTDTYGYPALNYGGAKGKTFDRVLILPHGPIRKYLKTGDLACVEGSVSKFYVAITRAKFSVAFVYDEDVPNTCKLWRPGQAGKA